MSFQETNQITAFLETFTPNGTIKVKHHEGLPRSIFFDQGKVIVLLKGDKIGSGISSVVKKAYLINSALILAEKRITDFQFPIRIEPNLSMEWDDHFVERIMPFIQGRGVIPYVARRKQDGKSFIYEKYSDSHLGSYIKATELSTQQKIAMVDDLLHGIVRIHSVTIKVLGLDFPLSHGDLKPHNIMVDPETGQLAITDFGAMGWIDNYHSTSRYLSPQGMKKQKEQKGVTQDEICSDLIKSGQKRDMWSVAIIIALIASNKIDAFFMPPLSFLNSRMTNHENNPRDLFEQFSTLTQQEIAIEFNDHIFNAPNVQEKNLWKLCARLFNIDDEKRCTAQEALRIYKEFFPAIA